MPSQIKSDLKSESAQDTEHPVVRGSTNVSAQDAKRRVVRGSTKGDASRANGAKSRGPVTPEGRAKSARNSIRHGLRAKSIVLPTESKEEYQSLLDSYHDQFDPQTAVEMELVEAMAVARPSGFCPDGALLGSNASGSLNRYFFAPACQLVTTVMDSPSAAFSPPPVTFTRQRWPSR